MKRLQLIFAVSCIGVFVPSASADSLTTLNDWCVNVSGDLGSCNNSMSSNPAVNLVAFDTTIGLNLFGTVTVTLGSGTNQFVDFYGDYDIDYAAYLSYNDNGSTTNSLATDQSYSIGDPNGYDVGSSPTHYTLFDMFANNTLDNSNTAGTPYSGNPQCCDIALAMGFSNITVDAGGSAVVTFAISSTAPSSGFYITQASNDITVAPFYLSGSVDITSGAPEPTTFLLGGGSLALGWFFVRRRRLASNRD